MLKNKMNNKTMKTFFKSLLLTGIMILSAEQALFAQAAVVEHEEKSEFEKKHLRESEREAVKIDKVLTNSSIQVLKNNWERRIELIGIELPELDEVMQLVERAGIPENEKERYKMMYYEARSALKDHVNTGDVLFIEQDVRKKNTYGNLLVYLYAPNRRIINIELIRQGYAYPVKDIDNKAYEDEMFKALEYAIDHKNGLYKIWQVKAGGVDAKGGSDGRRINIKKKKIN